MRLRGYVEYQVSRKGKVLRRGRGANLVTTLGVNLAASNFEADSGVRITHAALGDGNATPTAADTALASEIAGSRVAKTSDTVTDNEIAFVFQWTAGGNWDMSEVGLFTASVGGSLIARFLTELFNLQSGDVVDLTWTLAFEAE